YPAVVGFEFPADRGLAGQALKERRAVRAGEYAALEAPVPHPAYRVFASAIVAPMEWDGETHGVLGVGALDSGRVFTDSDVDALASFATIASLALRNAESFEQRERQARVD